MSKGIEIIDHRIWIVFLCTCGERLTITDFDDTIECEACHKFYIWQIKEIIKETKP